MTGRKHRRGSALSPPRVIGWLLLGGGIACFLYLVYRYNFTQDDAYITFRYAANFLHGDGLVYNAGERVEGFTNFLWTILMILGGRTGLDFVIFSKILGSIFGLGGIVLLYCLARDIFADIVSPWRDIFPGLCCLILGTVYSYAYWSVAGLETAAFGFMLTAAVYAYIRRSPAVVPLLVLATLLRPEGGLIFIFLVLYELISRKRLGRYPVAIIIAYLVFLLPLAAFKYAYYGSLLPNPFYAKTGFTFTQLFNGLDYTGRFFWHYLGAGILALPAVIAFRRAPRAVRVILVFLAVYIAYIILVGGDVLKVHRFFVPVMPLLILAVVYGFHVNLRSRVLLPAAVLILMGWQLYVPLKYITTFHSREMGLVSKMDRLTTELLNVDSSDFSLAASTIGIVGYNLRGHTVIDMLGLTDTTIARHPEPAIAGLETTWRESRFNCRYLLSRQPDYILFSTGFKPSAPAERSLFLYRAFLDSYRSTAVYFDRRLHTIFKRFYPIEGDIVRDMPVEFVQTFNRAINLVWNSKDYPKTLATLDSVRPHCPSPDYPYVNLYASYVYRNMKDNENLYRTLRKIIEQDTLVFQAYKDLCLFEYSLKNMEAAQFCREQTARLIPFYIPRLDSLLIMIKESMDN